MQLMEYNHSGLAIYRTEFQCVPESGAGKWPVKPGMMDYVK
jgi:hypothetical protein